MKKFLAIYGLGFVFGVTFKEFIEMRGELKKAKKAEKDFLALKAKIDAALKEGIESHTGWTEEQKQQLRDLGYSVK